MTSPRNSEAPAGPTTARGLRLTSGRRCRLSKPRLLYNAARTRRKPWPHVHVLIADSVAGKRRGLVLFQLKHLLRWRRWPLLRHVVEAR